jgi:hypothetical protein
MSYRLHKLAGTNPVYLCEGYDAFVTTSATKDIIVPFSRVLSVSLTPIGAPATTEAQLSVDETVSGTTGSDDAVIKGTAGSGSTTLTVTRPAGTTSGLKFSFMVIGEP